MTSELPRPGEPSQAAGRSYLLRPIASRHEQQSRQWIASAAQQVEPGRAVVLGAGACSEIPLAALVERFDHVTLNDARREPLEGALANLDARGRAKIDLQVGDLTGVTEPLLEQIEQELRTIGDAKAAIERMAEIVASQAAGGMPLAGQHDLVVASCVLSQLHFSLTHRAGDLFAARFGGRTDELHSAERWTSALYQLARRIEDRFVDSLLSLVTEQGLIYASESVQMCYVQATADGQWRSEGTFRMLRSTDLSEYFDLRFTILRRGRWEWVVWPPTAAGQTGRLYDVQALVMKKGSGA